MTHFSKMFYINVSCTRETYDLWQERSQGSRRRRACEGNPDTEESVAESLLLNWLFINSMFKRKKNYDDANHRTKVEICSKAIRKGLFKNGSVGRGRVSGRKERDS